MAGLTTSHTTHDDEEHDDMTTNDDDLQAAAARVTAFLDERARPTPFAPAGFLPVDMIAMLTSTGHTLRPSDLRTILAALAERIADRGGDDQ